MNTLVAATAIIADPYVLAVIVAASTLGIVIGAIPGLTAVMGTALLVPITFFMDPVPAVAAIVSMAAMAIFAGDIPGALLRIPGTPASAAYVDDAYALTRQGKPEIGLGMCMASACIGGLIGTVVLIVAAPALARFALGFSSVEYFWLGLLGLTCAAFVSGDSKLKGACALMLGLFVSTIGIDPAAGVPRYTFGSIELMGGVSFIPAMIGMFAVSQVLRNAVMLRGRSSTFIPTLGPVFKGLGQRLKTYKKNIFRGSLIGTAVGALPGAGADIAAWVAYAVSRSRSRNPETFGKGSVEGIASAGAANNGSLSSAWVPTLVFGVPGDSITAIVIGVLILKGMEPGPMIFINTPELAYAVFIAFLLANLLLIPLGWMVIKLGRHLLRVPQTLLLPIVLIACMVGAYAINNTLFGVGIMLAFGVLGWLMEENGFPVAPAILGIVLGGMVEFNFVTTMLKADGNLLAFFSRPIAACLGLITLGVWFFPLIKLFVQRRTRESNANA